MKFNVNQQDLQKSLNYCQCLIEKRSTLPILSNILLDASSSKLTITATDLDLIFIHQISNVEILEEGKTTTSSSIMYDIVRKIPSGSKINFSNPSENKLQLDSEKSLFKSWYIFFPVDVLNTSVDFRSVSAIIESSDVGLLFSP